MFLSLPPLSHTRRYDLARLACLIHAANVHSEPGSNPSILFMSVKTSKKFSFDLGSSLGQKGTDVYESSNMAISKVEDFSPTVLTLYDSNFTRLLNSAPSLGSIALAVGSDDKG